MFRRRLLVVLTCTSVLMSVLSALGYVTSLLYGTHFSSVTPAGWHTFNYGAGGCNWEHRTTNQYLPPVNGTDSEGGIPGWLGFRSYYGTRCVYLPGLTVQWCFQVTGYRQVYVSMRFFHLAIAAALIPMTYVIFTQLRHFSRRKHGRCLICGYDLTGNESHTCPECGTPICDRPNTTAAKS